MAPSNGAGNRYLSYTGAFWPPWMMEHYVFPGIATTRFGPQTGLFEFGQNGELKWRQRLAGFEYQSRSGVEAGVPEHRICNLMESRDLRCWEPMRPKGCLKAGPRALAGGLVKEDCGGTAHVQGINALGHGNGRGLVAGRQRCRGKSISFAAKDQTAIRLELGLR